VSKQRLTHLDDSGSARMVDVAGKQTTLRVARARARVRMSPATARAVAAGNGPKGEVLGVARLAGIQAAKQTSQLIPLAHNLPLTVVDVTATVDVEEGLVELIGEVRTIARTGVEMEAMVACAVAGLTIYDMVKGIERGISIEEVVLLEKRGGRSDFARAGTGAPAADGHDRPSASQPAAVIITISTSKAAGEGEDESGARLAELAEGMGIAITAREILTDERSQIEERLRHWIAQEGCSLILTTGGTGMAPSDVTPEATRAVIERDAPGLAEAMRDASREHTRNWMLSRGVAGIAGSTLIVNFPGAPASIEQAGAALARALPHALELLGGAASHHAH
jgi:cyclic pyranopterin monophosphate synthase